MNEQQRRGRGRPQGSRDSYKRRAPVASAIERQLGLTEEPQAPRHTRRRPLGQ